MNVVFRIFLVAVFLNTFCSFGLERLGKPYIIKTEVIGNIAIDAGVFLNDAEKEVVIVFNNPFDFPLVVNHINRSTQKKYVFSTDYYYGRTINAKDSFGLTFTKPSSYRNFKDAGSYTDAYQLNLVNEKGDRFTCEILIHYELIRNQTYLEQGRVTNLKLAVDDTVNTIFVLKNTGELPVTVTTIKLEDGLTSNAQVPFIVNGKDSVYIPIQVNRGSEYGRFSKSVTFASNENVRRPKFTGKVNGEVIGDLQPVITFDTLSIDKGEMAYAGDGTFVYRFTNTGKAPLVISMVKSSCGCVVPRFDRKVYQPGDSGEIIAKYDTRRVGPFKKTVTVFSNATYSKVVLRLMGKVAPKPVNVPLSKN